MHINWWRAFWPTNLRGYWLRSSNAIHKLLIYQTDLTWVSKDKPQLISSNNTSELNHKQDGEHPKPDHGQPDLLYIKIEAHQQNITSHQKKKKRSNTVATQKICQVTEEWKATTYLSLNLSPKKYKGHAPNFPIWWNAAFSCDLQPPCFLPSGDLPVVKQPHIL